MVNKLINYIFCVKSHELYDGNFESMLRKNIDSFQVKSSINKFYSVVFNTSSMVLTGSIPVIVALVENGYLSKILTTVLPAIATFLLSWTTH